MDNSDTLTLLCREANRLGVTTTEFWNQVKRLDLAETDVEAAAEEIISGLRAGGITCPKCQGSGIFQFRDGRTGPCYSCKGKGLMDVSDLRRCWGYRRHNPGRQEAYVPSRR
jgi:hypothetical protein